MSWRSALLGEVCNIKKGVTGISKAIPGRYPLVVTGEERKSHNEYQFNCDAVIVPLVSSTGHGHASINRIHFQQGKFALGTILCAIIPKDYAQLNAEYLYRFLDSNKEVELVARMKGMANVTLSIKEIAKIEIPLPPLEKQIALVESYNALEAKSNLIENELGSQLLLLEKLNKQIIKDAIQGKLVAHNPDEEPASELLKKIKSEKSKLVAEKKLKNEKELPPLKPEEIPFKIPENWMWCRLGEVISLISGQDLAPTDYSDNDNFGIPYITGASNLDNGSVILNRWTNNPKSIAIKGDLLLTCKGSIGKMAILKENKVHIARQIMAIQSNFISKDFIKFFLELQVENFREEAKSLIPGINRDLVLTLPFPLPPLSELNYIVQKLEELMKYCSELEESIKQSKSQNKKLLQQVLKEALLSESIIS